MSSAKDSSNNNDGVQDSGPSEPSDNGKGILTPGPSPHSSEAFPLHSITRDNDINNVDKPSAMFTSSNVDALVGGLVGAAIVVLATVIFGWCFIRRRRRRQEALNRSFAVTQEPFFTAPFPSGLSPMVHSSSGMMSPSTSTSPTSHSYMSQTSVPEVPVSMTGFLSPEARNTSPILRKKPVPYLDVSVSRSGSISLPTNKMTNPFADPGPSSLSEPLKNPFDDPEGTEVAPDVPKQAVLPATSAAERRFSDDSVTSVTSTGAPKKASILFSVFYLPLT
ncbi:hypothetical protein C0993_009217 [Termitomyces sp. T159_Od127]|nr:hypothetical protein C0993_009217 [Termitomyces sp. T159_Od127]